MDIDAKIFKKIFNEITDLFRIGKNWIQPESMN